MANAKSEGAIIRSSETGRARGPQEITLHGRSVAVVLSRDDFDQLASTHQSLVEFIQHSPLYGLEDLILARDKNLTVVAQT